MPRAVVLWQHSVQEFKLIENMIWLLREMHKMKKTGVGRITMPTQFACLCWTGGVSNTALCCGAEEVLSNATVAVVESVVFEFSWCADRRMNT